MMNIFEKVTKDKIRFDYKGQISTEELWDLDVEELDSIFKTLNAQKKTSSQDSLLKDVTPENTLINTQIKIVTHIVEYKIARANAQVHAKALADKKAKILEILANKQDDALQNKTVEELTEMVDNL